MKLNVYLKSLSRIEQEDFLSRCKRSLGVMRNIACGAHRPGAALCIDIERESHGAVTCEELRPDVDWAYLRNSRVSHPERQMHEKSE